MSLVFLLASALFFTLFVLVARPLLPLLLPRELWSVAPLCGATSMFMHGFLVSTGFFTRRAVS